MSVERTYERHGLRYAVYDHLDQRNVIGRKEIESVDTPLFEEAPTDIVELNYEDGGPVEPRQMLIETLMDMEKRPGAVLYGLRPVQPRQHAMKYVPITAREKTFIDTHVEDYPITIIAMAIGLNPYSVKDYLSDGQKTRPPLRGRRFGEEDAIALRYKWFRQMPQYDEDK